MKLTLNRVLQKGTVSKNAFKDIHVPKTTGDTRIKATPENIAMAGDTYIVNNKTQTLHSPGEVMAAKALLAVMRSGSNSTWYYNPQQTASFVDGWLYEYKPAPHPTGRRPVVKTPVELKFSNEGNFEFHMSSQQLLQCQRTNALVFVLQPPAKKRNITFAYRLGRM